MTRGHYCANCGQETALALPAFRAFMRDAAGRYVALDGRLWRTLYALLARPGFLTLEYFAGRRRRYIRPARLFLVLYLLLFALIGVLQSPADMADQVVFVDEDVGARGAVARDAGKAVSKSAAPVVRSERGAGSAKVTTDSRGTKGIVAASDDHGTSLGLDDQLNFSFKVGGVELEPPGFLRKRLEHFKGLSREEKAERLYSGMLRFGVYAMIVLLPVFALLLKLAYFGRGDKYPGRPRRYAEHLVYSAHIHAFAALALMLFVLVPDGPLRAAIALWVAYYVLKARAVVYRGRWWAAVLRGVVVATIYLLVVAAVVVGLLAVAALVR